MSIQFSILVLIVLFATIFINYGNSQVIADVDDDPLDQDYNWEYIWSPEGNYLAFYQKDESNVTDYPLVDINTYPASLKNIKHQNTLKQIQ